MLGLSRQFKNVSSPFTRLVASASLSLNFFCQRQTNRKKVFFDWKFRSTNRPGDTLPLSRIAEIFHQFSVRSIPANHSLPINSFVIEALSIQRCRTYRQEEEVLITGVSVDHMTKIIEKSAFPLWGRVVPVIACKDLYENKCSDFVGNSASCRRSNAAAASG